LLFCIFVSILILLLILIIAAMAATLQVVVGTYEFLTLGYELKEIDKVMIDPMCDVFESAKKLSCLH